MRILIFADKFYPKIVGSGTATYFIANDLAKRGHDVTVIVGQEYKKILKDTPLPFKLCYIADYTAFMTGETSFRNATTEIYSKLSKSNFDIIHVFNYMPMLLLSLMRDMFSSPIVFTFWNTPYKSERAMGFYNESNLDTQLARNIIGLKKYDQMILGSQCSYDSALIFGADAKTTLFKYCGIDIDQFNNDMNNYSKMNLDIYFGNSLKENDILVTLPGRITERKGIIEAIYAIDKISKKYPVKLLLTGMSDPHSKEFANIVLQRIEDLQIKNQVIFPLKTIPRHYMPAIYKRSNIVITPSHYEGLGFTAIEALAAGRPLIATNVPGLNEIGIDEKNCLLISPKNSDELAKSLVRLLDDQPLALRLAKAGPDSIKKFDMKLFVNFILEKYPSIINKKRGKIYE